MLGKKGRALELGVERRNTNWVGMILLAMVGLALVSCNTTQVGFDYEPAVARFVIESNNGGSMVTMPVSGARIQVNPTAVLSEYDLENVSVAEVELGQCLQFTLTHRASRIFYQASASNQGKRIVLVVNGQALGLQRIDRPVSDGILYVFMEIPDADLPELAKNLKGTTLDIQSKIRG